MEQAEDSLYAATTRAASALVLLATSRSAAESLRFSTRTSLGLRSARGTSRRRDASGQRLVLGLGLRRAFKRAVAVVREVTRPAAPAVGLVSDALRSRPALRAENVLLRQQLVVVHRQVKRPVLTQLDRLVVIAASALTGAWRGSLLLVQPANRTALAPAGVSDHLALEEPKLATASCRTGDHRAHPPLG